MWPSGRWTNRLRNSDPGMARCSPPSPKIKLQSSDGEVFDVDVQTAIVSGTLRTMLEDLDRMKRNEDEEVVPLLNVKAAILRKVIQWATYHRDELMVVVEENSYTVSSWDAEFFNVDQATLYELIRVADYLDIKGLLEAACKMVARTLSGKSTEEMRRLLGIKSDMTSSEELQVKKETEWYEGSPKS
ncbi:S-phase kinase-associated protein 1-like [Ornithodoros turicata]|uniref:S-phase kinase-associated protein 1-like n=1 Tax=Ornithodoros turicata TaxID=34597 RepID=UPI003139B778